MNCSKYMYMQFSGCVTFIWTDIDNFARVLEL